jgi:hypothetical protein
VSTPEKKRMHAGEAVRIDSHAAATLRYIRASMDAAASLALPGSTAMTAGGIGLLAALVSSLPGLAAHWLIIWLVAAVIAASAGSFLLLRNSSAEALTISGSPVRKFAMCFLPSLAAGAVMTAVHWSYGNEHAIPGTWLILYGCALISASAATMQLISFIGAGFFGLGVLALFAPSELQIFLLGLGFGALHILLGYLIGRTGKAAEPDDLRSTRKRAKG